MRREGWRARAARVGKTGTVSSKKERGRGAGTHVVPSDGAVGLLWVVLASLLGLVDGLLESVGHVLCLGPKSQAASGNASDAGRLGDSGGSGSGDGAGSSDGAGVHGGGDDGGWFFGLLFALVRPRSLLFFVYCVPSPPSQEIPTLPDLNPSQPSPCALIASCS